MEALRHSMEGTQKNIVAAAQEKSADKFTFKTTPQQMSWGKAHGHIAFGGYLFCSNLSGRRQPVAGEPKDTDSKDKLISAVKRSFEFCSSALANVDDSTFNDQIGFSTVMTLDRRKYALVGRRYANNLREEQAHSF